eukprot:jgi/Chrpa1/21594/Chrysochromulina_OHIO_Genome00003800-RA
MKLNAGPIIAGAQRSAAAFALSGLLLLPTIGVVPPALADGDTKEFRFPPIDRAKKDRCKFVSSAMGQANAARDSLYDLRECVMTDSSAAKFDGADFSNGIVDRAFFKGSSFRGTIFNNAVLSGTSFEEADLTDADFTDAYIGQFDQQRICKNPTLKGENPTTKAPTRESAGCT